MTAARGCALLLLFALALPGTGRALAQRERGRDSLPRGASLAVEDHESDVLVSPDGAFACGFYAVSPTVFTFSVWFARSADRAVVWTAAASATARRAVHSQGSRLALDARRGALLLTDYDGEVVWNSTAHDGAARARLRDTGNLAVEDARGAVLWQSFDHPTDTLLPAQRLGGAAGSGLVSTSRLLAAGHYGFRFSDYAMLSMVYGDGGQVSSIYWPNPYFSYWQNSRKIYNFSREAELDSTGHFLASDNATFDAADLGVAGVRRRLTLDTDGNLRLYSLDAGGQTWTVSWMAFSNPCIIHGVCGINAVCLYTPSPACVCAPGHERADRSDWSRGCRPTFSNSTGGRDEQVKFVALPHTDFWGFDLNNSEFLSLDACEAQCTGEPSCVVFQYKQGKGECYPKSLMFNGRTFPGLPGTAYLKVPADFNVPELHVHQWQTDDGLAIQEDIAGCDAAAPEVVMLNVSSTAKMSSNQGKSLWFYFYGFLSAFFVIEVFVIAFGCWLFSKKGILSRPSELLAVEEGYRMITSHFRAYSYSELQSATRKFRAEIGHGGSGTVYKGVLDDDRTVAVKVLQDVSQSEEVFQAELSAIGRIYHMNLVRMWGFCSEGAHRILVYEYVHNGSLANVLFQSTGNSGRLLGWRQRFNIAVGVAKGLAYLHNECLEWIIHCDMKPENILLDDEMEPKITDFGLAKLLNRDGSDSGLSRIRGTRGYMAPEWVSSLPTTEKVDVYSYGVVLLELMKGKRVSDWVVDGKEGFETDVRTVVKMIVDRSKHSNGGWVADLVDERLDGEFNHAQAKIFAQLAVSCLEEDRNKRPGMKNVVQTLISADDESRDNEYPEI
ncbi:putative receptor protein kinase ZmPK1 [Triticum urartu]|uniref:putative receptor protein kinase ZmPK1 n=1 Tax=Triticum urartu TaxID=4572 RepID=UPI0020441B43|nr:putative receptor protein kinase ZmPK1 [Triticum urartu]